jgi:hypothetical protein
MADRFESAWQKIARARKHGDELEAEVSSFWASEPYEVEVVGTPMTGMGSYRVTHMDPLPESIPLIAGDAAHNIRSALDHFVCAVVRRPERATSFPVWSTSKRSVPTAVQWRKSVEEKLRGASPSLVQAVMNLEAWETGRDSLLWAIHELDRVDKHRLLISIAVANTGIRVDGSGYVFDTIKKFSGYGPGQHLALEPIKWTPLKNGTILFNVEDGSIFGAANATKTTFTFDMTLGEPEMLKGESAVRCLRTLAGLAEKTIRDLAALA